MSNAKNILISDADYQSIALKFQSLDLVLRGLGQMIDEEGSVVQHDIDAVKKVFSELFCEFLELNQYAQVGGNHD
jgi:hypothetical protein